MSTDKLDQEMLDAANSEHRVAIQGGQQASEAYKKEQVALELVRKELEAK